MCGDASNHNNWEMTRMVLQVSSLKCTCLALNDLMTSCDSTHTFQTSICICLRRCCIYSPGCVFMIQQRYGLKGFFRQPQFVDLISEFIQGCFFRTV